MSIHGLGVAGQGSPGTPDRTHRSRWGSGMHSHHGWDRQL